MGLSYRLRGLSNRLRGLGNRLRGFSNRLRGFSTRLRGLSTRLRGLSTRLRGLGNRPRLRVLVTDWGASVPDCYKTEVLAPDWRVLTLDWVLVPDPPQPGVKTTASNKSRAKRSELGWTSVHTNVFHWEWPHKTVQYKQGGVNRNYKEKWFLRCKAAHHLESRQLRTSKQANWPSTSNPYKWKLTNCQAWRPVRYLWCNVMLRNTYLWCNVMLIHTCEH